MKQYIETFIAAFISVILFHLLMMWVVSSIGGKYDILGFVMADAFVLVICAVIYKASRFGM
jgi:hypothetical protein